MPKIAALLFLLLTACGTVPMASPADDAAGKNFAPPQSGSAALYVYRDDTIGGLRTVDITAGQSMLGSLAWHTWLRVDLPAGPHDVRCKFEGVTSLPITLAAGEIRYLNIYFSAGKCHLREVAAAVAQPAIAAGQRAAELR